MFLHNLNVFFPLYILLAYVLSGVLTVFLYPFLSTFPVNVGAFLFRYGSLLIIALVLIIIWWRVGLSPKNPRNDLRFKKGHIVVATTSLVILVLALISYFLLANHIDVGPAIRKFIYYLKQFGPFTVLIAWLVGITMVWSSK